MMGRTMRMKVRMRTEMKMKIMGSHLDLQPKNHIILVMVSIIMKIVELLE